MYTELKSIYFFCGSAADIKIGPFQANPRNKTPQIYKNQNLKSSYSYQIYNNIVYIMKMIIK